MIERILNFLFRKKEIVNCDRDVYLHRWYIIRTKWFAVFVHKFIRSDEDRALHCHPWDFLVIPVWRGYIEHSDKPKPSWWKGEDWPRIARQRRVYPILGTRFRRAEYRHRVELLERQVACDYCHGKGKDPEENLLTCPSCNGERVVAIEEPRPAWSIFVRFRERRVWGFHEKEGFIAWNKWWQDKCED